MHFIIATLSRVWRWLSKWLRHGPQPTPPPPKIIQIDSTYVAAGPELLLNGSFENGDFGPGNEVLVDSSSPIVNWAVLSGAPYASVRWIRTPHPFFDRASDGARFIDLTGGTPLPAAPKFATLRAAGNFFQNGQSVPYVRRYECALDLGVGPNNGALADFGPPIKVTVQLDALNLSQQLVFDPPVPPVSGVKWERFAFRVEIAPGYVVGASNYSIQIAGNAGKRFVGVDNVSVRAVALQPQIIQNNPASDPTGPNLVKNGSFETGNLPGTTAVITPTDPQIIENWQVTGNTLQWIGAGHPLFINASNGSRFVDLTGGLLPGPYPELAILYQDGPLGLQAGKSYEVAVDIGVGPNNGSDDNFGPPVALSVAVIAPPGTVTKTFICNAAPPAGTGVTWETHRFRFAVPFDYPLSPTNQTIMISGNIGNRFVGVDNLSVRLLT